ncbi:MAG: NAD dependent epimerase/dehydratase family enzyme, partial [Granulosicoccus sp.]
MAEKVLITGGSGMVGRRLSAMLTEHGYEVSILTRATSANIPYKQYIWDISKNEIDPEAILNCNYIVHLAGAGITDKRWT